MVVPSFSVKMEKQIEVVVRLNTGVIMHIRKRRLLLALNLSK